MEFIRPIAVTEKRQEHGVPLFMPT